VRPKTGEVSIIMEKTRGTGNKINKALTLLSYIVDGVDEGIAAGVAHGQPVERKPHNVDIFVPARRKKL